MDITEKNLDEARAMYAGMDFQWIKGDDALSIETFKSMSLNGEIAFIEFTSGKRINLDLLEELKKHKALKLKKRLVKI